MPINRTPKAFWIFILVFLAASIITVFAVGQDCHCGGCVHDAEPMAVNGRVVRYYIGPGKMHGIDQAETRRLIRKGYAEFSAICGLEFQEVTDKARARIKYEFHGNNSVLYSGKDKNGKPLYALGKAWTSGRIALNTARKLKNVAKNRYVERLVYHETLHVFGWKHVNDKGCIMHPHLTAQYFCPSEVKRAIRQWREPPKLFHPVDRMNAGTLIRDERERIRLLWEVHTKLVAQRTEIVESGKWRSDHPLQPRILNIVNTIRTLNKKLGDHARKWHEINKRWKGVKGVVQL